MNDLELYRSYFREFNRTASQRCRDYVGGTDEPNGQAASLEALCCFRELVLNSGVMNPLVLDAGAGASTWMLRHWFGDRVVTIDPDMAYLNEVRTVCIQAGLPSFNFCLGVSPSYEDGSQRGRDVMDFTFWDYGTRHRAPLMPIAWASTRHAMYVDDCDDRPDCAPLRSFAHDLAFIDGADIYDVREARDSFGRWGVVIRRKA